MKKSESRRKATALREQQIRSKVHSAPSGNSSPIFVADVMLGRLAKWLRIAGFDVLYSNRFADNELVILSRQEGRILLSRDTRLLVRKAVERFIYLESDDVRSQLQQVFKTAQTARLPGILTRCLSCNDLLVEIPREGVRERVPPYVYQTQSHFKCCPKCGKIYWAGTHRQSVLRTLENLLQR